MNKSFFLWPAADHSGILTARARFVTPEDVERKLESLYPDAHPVLFSSGRAGLNALVQHLQLTRKNLIWLPKFSSHCVIESVGRICTPTPHMSDAVSAALIYHQWGHVHRAHFDEPTILIEDAVDSLFVPGSAIFKTSAKFTLWSLPKTIGTLAGGVVFCRDPVDAQAIRSLRDGRPKSALQASLRFLSKSNRLASRYWVGAEAVQGAPIGPYCGQIMRSLGQIDALVEDRAAVLAFVSKDLADTFLTAGRLPSNLPVTPPSGWQAVWGSNGPLAAGLRSFNVARSCPDDRWMEVAPLPVHKDVGRNDIESILSMFGQEGQSHDLEFV